MHSPQRRPTSTATTFRSSPTPNSVLTGARLCLVMVGSIQATTPDIEASPHSHELTMWGIPDNDDEDRVYVLRNSCHGAYSLFTHFTIVTVFRDSIAAMASQSEKLSLVEGSLAKLASWTSLYWILSTILIYQIIRHLQQIFRSDLRNIPGPTIARLTSYWRPWVLLGGQCPEVYYDLHRKYGPLVRTAPNVVSISDPSAIPKIYGIGSKFHKVRHPLILLKSASHANKHGSPSSTLSSTSPTKTPSCQACSPSAPRHSTKPSAGQSPKSSP